MTPDEHRAEAHRIAKHALARMAGFGDPMSLHPETALRVAQAHALVAATAPEHPSMEWGPEHETGQMIEWEGYRGVIVLDGDPDTSFSKYRWRVLDYKGGGERIAENAPGEVVAKYEARLAVERVLAGLADPE